LSHALGGRRVSGVAAIDVRDAFRTVIAGKQEVFYRADFHWTALAEATAAIEQDRPPVPPTGTDLCWEALRN